MRMTSLWSVVLCVAAFGVNHDEAHGYEDRQKAAARAYLQDAGHRPKAFELVFLDELRRYAAVLGRGVSDVYLLDFDHMKGRFVGITEPQHVPLTAARLAARKARVRFDEAAIIKARTEQGLPTNVWIFPRAERRAQSYYEVQIPQQEGTSEWVKVRAETGEVSPAPVGFTPKMARELVARFLEGRGISGEKLSVKALPDAPKRNAFFFTATYGPKGDRTVLPIVISERLHADERKRVKNVGIARRTGVDLAEPRSENRQIVSFEEAQQRAAEALKGRDGGGIFCTGPTTTNKSYAFGNELGDKVNVPFYADGPCTVKLKKTKKR